MGLVHATLPRRLWRHALTAAAVDMTTQLWNYILTQAVTVVVNIQMDLVGILLSLYSRTQDLYYDKIYILLS